MSELAKAAEKLQEAAALIRRSTERIPQPPRPPTVYCDAVSPDDLMCDLPAGHSRVRFLDGAIVTSLSKDGYDHGNAKYRTAWMDRASRVITIPRPVVPYCPSGEMEDQSTARYFREAAHKLGGGGHSELGGSNLTATVRKTLLDCADALDPLGLA